MRRLEQELPEEGNLTVYETVAQAFDQTSHEAWESEQAIQRHITGDESRRHSNALMIFRRLETARRFG